MSSRNNERRRGTRGGCKCRRRLALPPAVCLWWRAVGFAARGMAPGAGAPAPVGAPAPHRPPTSARALAVALAVRHRLEVVKPHGLLLLLPVTQQGGGGVGNRWMRFVSGGGGGGGGRCAGAGEQGGGGFAQRGGRRVPGAHGTCVHASKQAAQDRPGGPAAAATQRHRSPRNSLADHLGRPLLPPLIKVHARIPQARGY